MEELNKLNESQNGFNNRTIESRKQRKRNKSQATFMKRNLTLSIDLIEKDNKINQSNNKKDINNKNDGQSNNASFSKRVVSDNQEDSPIREGDY